MSNLKEKTIDELKVIATKKGITYPANILDTTLLKKIEDFEVISKKMQEEKEEDKETIEAHEANAEAENIEEEEEEIEDEKDTPSEDNTGEDLENQQTEAEEKIKAKVKKVQKPIVKIYTVNSNLRHNWIMYKSWSKFSGSISKNELAYLLKEKILSK